MFGYINVNGAQLSEENKKIYQSYYCGLCRKLKEFCGKKGQALLNYDMTFLVVLLTGLYEPDTQTGEFTCMMHPMKKRQLRENDIQSYAAQMNVLLAYYNLVDDWKDDHNYTKQNHCLNVTATKSKSSNYLPQKKFIQILLNGIGLPRIIYFDPLIIFLKH